MDDIRLVKNCLAGDRAAQKALYVQHASVMLAVCYRFTKSMSDAEDILQEGFIKVFANLHQYKFDGALGGWIRRIMVRTAINYLKKNSRYQNDLVFTDDHLHVVAADNPEIQLSAKELADLIRQLPSGYQTIFNLYAVEGYSHAEIGDVLGIKEGTSRSQYARARALLIQWLGKQDAAIKTSSYAK